MGRPSGTKSRKREVDGTLRVELQRQIERGRCAYCGTSAEPDAPLTREHVIPRARGGRRKDVRIIVPACARCNHHRGCRDLVPFLLARPRRIASFLDYLGGLTPESIRQIDMRIYAELYASVAILRESLRSGMAWRAELERLCSGRPLHRRRYAARRAIWAIAARLEGRGGFDGLGGPSCPLHWPGTDGPHLHLEEPLERLAARLLSVLSLLWAVPSDVVEREMGWELLESTVDSSSLDSDGRDALEGDEEDGVLPLDGWRTRRRRKRLRVDRRQGGAGRAPQRSIARGRAA